MNKEFENRVIDYKMVFNQPGAIPAQNGILGVPGDYTPPSRFVKATVITDNMVAPQNSAQAKMQAVQALGNDATIGVTHRDLSLWYAIKDLDNLVFYSKNLYYHQTDNSLYAYDATSGYESIELKNINFNVLPQGSPKEFKALSADEAAKLKVLDISEVK